MTEQSQQHPYRPDEIEAMLALATTGEPSRDSRTTNTDYSQLTASEIVAAVHAVKDAEGRRHQQHLWEIGNPGSFPAEVRDVDHRLDRYDIDTLLDQMPKIIGVDKTRDVFTMLASGSSTGKHIISHYIGVLTKVDHDYGLALWRRLLKDEDPEVGQSVWDSVIELRDRDDPEKLVKGLAEDGLTLADWMGLISSYVSHLHGSYDVDDPER